MYVFIRNQKKEKNRRMNKTLRLSFDLIVDYYDSFTAFFFLVLR